MNKRMPMTTVVVLLTIALASVGVGYGLWSKTLLIDGVVNTGNVDSIFVKYFTDDDNQVDDKSKDLADDGECALYGNGSCDPAGSGKLAPRKDKDVGVCIVALDEADETGETLLVTISNAYPSYYCTVFFDIKNNGSVPVKILSMAAMGPHITVAWSELFIGQQIDPGDVVQGDLELHVEQSAPQGSELTLVGKIQLAQWNEATPLTWAQCTPGADPCNQSPEVSFAGNTVIMGQLGEGDTNQSESVHGGAAMLPAGSSYEVTFQYHVCTWDSYNEPGTPGSSGTGWWDSFSVSTSDQPYWDIGLTDPISTANLPGLGFIWGGFDFGDSVLECMDGTATALLPGYSGGTYLNVVLDTGTEDYANGAHPSYGTITVEKVVVNP